MPDPERAMFAILRNLKSLEELWEKNTPIRRDGARKLGAWFGRPARTTVKKVHNNGGDEAKEKTWHTHTHKTR